MEKNVAGVVTYNRLDKLKCNLNCLLSQTVKLYKIIVVDNCSSDGTESYLAEMTKKYSNIEVKRTSSNIGGSGGFNLGVKTAYDDGADYIWGMDDDAYPRPDALEKLIISRNKYGNQNAYWSNCNNDNDFSNDVKTVNIWMFVGFYIGRNIIDKIGFPRGDFFIYYDDSEYADRIIKNKFNIYKVKDSIIDHQDAVGNVAFQITWFGKKINILKLPDSNWRLYYLVRNDILRFSYRDIRKYKIIVIRSGIRFFKVLFFSPKQIPIFMKGYYHGLIGRSGKTMSP